ncbi:hypothetical protein LG195_09170 [Proteus terrae]|uniref:hypothetical protein n=1 Tax=Proteus terrae TaxID=1574161 RepID=UPI00207D0FF0|nr:hypothetical protein [Proteus terrae]MCO4179569.1 hypothetical protein [Proteus terrae]MCO4189212.1 hypothetical protein [Proteus terrae]UXA34187.1 hypothetical protein KZA80_18315 [Proteus terrae]
MFNPELKPVQPARPGFAVLSIRNWEGDASPVYLSIQRNQDRYFLNDKGEWVGNAFFHQLSLEDADDGYQIVLDKTLVDPLVSNLQMAYQFTLKDDNETQDIGRLRIRDGVLASQAQGQSEALKSTATLDNQPVPPAPIIEETPPEPEPLKIEPEEIEPIIFEIKADEPPQRSTPPAPKKSKIGLILAIILILILAGILTWFFLLRGNPAGEPAPQPTSEPSTPSVCSVENMKSGTALAFVQSCIQSQPDSKTILATIEQAKQNNQCDVAQRLYAYKAQSGDVDIALNYAREYDPETASAQGCFSADKETAIYWYEAVLNHDSQNSDAKARLEALKK